MPSTFTGMDPYLEDESLWPDFHRTLVAAAHEILKLALAAGRYRVAVAERHYATPTPGGTQDHHESCLEIRESRDGRLVTLVDVVSPANKQAAAGRQAFLGQRRQALDSGANVVEIDLVLQGRPLLEYSRDGLPDWDYAVTVTRATQPDRFEVYIATLRKRLPRFRLPLAGDDRDTVVDLHTAFLRSFDQGSFAAKIDYSKDPATPLKDEDRRWLGELLKQQKLR